MATRVDFEQFKTKPAVEKKAKPLTKCVPLMQRGWKLMKSSLIIPPIDYDKQFAAYAGNASLCLERSDVSVHRFSRDFKNPCLEDLYSKLHQNVMRFRIRLATLLLATSFIIFLCMELVFAYYAHKVASTTGPILLESVAILTTMSLSIAGAIFIFLLTFSNRSTRCIQLAFIAITLIGVSCLLVDAILLVAVFDLSGWHDPELVIIVLVLAVGPIGFAPFKYTLYVFGLSLAAFLSIDLIVVLKLNSSSAQANKIFSLILRLAQEAVVLFLILYAALMEENIQRKLFLQWYSTATYLATLKSQQEEKVDSGQSAADEILSCLEEIEKSAKQLVRRMPYGTVARMGRSISDSSRMSRYLSESSSQTRDDQMAHFRALLEKQKRCLYLVAHSSNLYGIDVKKIIQQLQESKHEEKDYSQVQSVLQYVGLNDTDETMSSSLKQTFYKISEAEAHETFDILQNIKRKHDSSSYKSLVAEYRSNELKNSEELIEVMALLKKSGNSMNLNLIQMNQQGHCVNNLLVEVGMALLAPNLICTGIPVGETLASKERTLLHLLGRLQDTYYSTVPYHNQVHAAEVAHLMVYVLGKLNLLGYQRLDDITICEVKPLADELTRNSGADDVKDDASRRSTSNTFWGGSVFFATVLASLAHDAGHPGKNNNFIVNCAMPLALIYNDKSVLENYHTSVLFQLLQLQECDVFSSMPFSNRRNLRKNIVELILATDMAMHFDFIAELRVKSKSEKFQKLLEIKDAWFVVKIAIKLADLGHTFLQWDIHKEFSNFIYTEMLIQQDDEIRLGLPRSPLVLSRKEEDKAESQCSFIDYIVLPLLRELQLSVSAADLSECYDGLIENKRKWQDVKRLSLKTHYT